MSFVDEIKLETKLGIEWGNFDQENVIGRSRPLIALPFNMNKYLYIVKKEDNIYLKIKEEINFLTDDPETKEDTEKYLISTKDKKDFIDKYKLYTHIEEHDPTISPGMRMLVGTRISQGTQKSIEELLSKYDRSAIFYGGLANDMANLENGCTFNSYLCKTPLRQSTASWINDGNMTSIYKTFYSHSTIAYQIINQIKVETGKGIYHPLLITVNYQPTTNDWDDDVFPKDIPYDVIATLDKLYLKDKIGLKKLIDKKEDVEYHEMINDILYKNEFSYIDDH